MGTIVVTLGYGSSGGSRGRGGEGADPPKRMSARLCGDGEEECPRPGGAALNDDGGPYRGRKGGPQQKEHGNDEKEARETPQPPPGHVR